MSGIALPASTPGSGTFSLLFGFTRLCKGLSLLFLVGYGLLTVFPSATAYVALIPARTIPFAWNLITAGFVDQSLPGVIISIIGLLLLGKQLEPIWGPREFLKFIFLVNFLTYTCAFVTAIILYYISTQEIYLYTPLSGFHGVLCGFLVGIKQIIPDQELGVFKIKSKWIPSLCILLASILSFFVLEFTTYLPTIIFGVYTGWFYLRYLQRKPETSIRGDPSDEFSFSSFFPEFLRPILDPIASILHRMLCGRFDKAGENKGYTSGASPLPGSDPIEASRRRERGARALEQRLAAEKSSNSETTEELSGKGDENV
ncbi:putative Transmembrane protein [Zostera marina]|uniref:Putative Transmembrane protein n=1 Tax=Zostera marina TaxID=29655 RepID=A0A0K9PGH5_ZOSMR|nr:putative Transmembrane protein [Zostera marina]